MEVVTFRGGVANSSLAELTLPISQSLADVLARNGFALTQVRNRARDSHDMMIRARRQVKRLRTFYEQPASIRGEVASR